MGGRGENGQGEGDHEIGKRAVHRLALAALLGARHKFAEAGAHLRRLLGEVLVTGAEQMQSHKRVSASTMPTMTAVTPTSDKPMEM